MPVGTAGSVKTLSPRDLEELGAGIILGNTYHLYLRPGHERVRRLGGLHRFMSWDGALLTDSGGFQVYSLQGAGNDAGGSLVRIAEDGVTFRSHLDGSRHFLSPETSIARPARPRRRRDHGVRRVPAVEGRAALPRGLARPHPALARSLARCLARHRPDLTASAPRSSASRRAGSFPTCAGAPSRRPAPSTCPGYALGGYAVGEEPEEMWEGVARHAPELPREKPRYLMGVGTPEDLLAGIAAGVDMFDCVLPTRTARNGLLFTSRGRLTVKNARFADDERPARPWLHLLHLPDLLPGVPSPPLPGRRDPGAAPQHAAQRAPLPPAHGGGPGGHRGGALRGLPSGAARGVSPGAGRVGRTGGPQPRPAAFRGCLPGQNVAKTRRFFQ